MCLAQGSQRTDAGEARTRDPSVSSQALYHTATALPSFASKIRLYKNHASINQPRPCRNSAGHFI